MILDSSAIVAILIEEADREVILEAMALSQVRNISAATLFETAIVVDALRDPLVSRALDSLIFDFRVNVRDVTAAQVAIARRAYSVYGKGSGHPARLNFGDCFAYALAIDTDEPLLFKGDGFSHTDVRIALPNDR